MTCRSQQLGGYMREEHSRLRKQEQILLRKSMPETLLRKPRGQHDCQIAQGKGNAGGCEAGEVARGKWTSPLSVSYSFVTTDNFLSFSFLICKILFTLQGIVRTERSRNSSSAVPASNYHSLSTNYYHFY